MVGRRLVGGPERDEHLGCTVYRGRSDLGGLGWALAGMEASADGSWARVVVGELEELLCYDVRAYLRDDGNFDLVCRVFDEWSGYAGFKDALEDGMRYNAMMLRIKFGGDGL